MHICSDGSGLGLRPKPARPRGFLGARSSKPESPAGFFGPKIGQFLANLRPNLGKIMGDFCIKFFGIVIGQINFTFSNAFQLKWAFSGSILIQKTKTWKNVWKVPFLLVILGVFHPIKKPEIGPKPDTKKPGPPEARYTKARARPKPEKPRPATSLIYV